MLQLFNVLASQVIGDLVIVIKNQVINACKVFVVMPYLVGEDLSETFVVFVFGQIAVDFIKTAVIKHNVSAQGISLIFPQNKQIVIYRFRVHLQLWQKAHAAVELAIKFIGHGIGNLIKHFGTFFEADH